MYLPRNQRSRNQWIRKVTTLYRMALFNVMKWDCFFIYLFCFFFMQSYWINILFINRFHRAVILCSVIPLCRSCSYGVSRCTIASAWIEQCLNPLILDWSKCYGVCRDTPYHNTIENAPTYGTIFHEWSITCDIKMKGLVVHNALTTTPI
jgi:hypothetical protein